MTYKKNICKYFTSVGSLSDEQINLAEAALNLSLFAKKNIKLDAYWRHISAISRDVKSYLYGIKAPLGLEVRIEAVTHVIHKKYGYIVDPDEFKNNNELDLTSLIDCRIGNSITLGVLYLIILWRQKWSASGLNFPERFLIRLENNRERIIIDPSSGGCTLSTENLREILKINWGYQEELKPEYFNEVSKRDILLNMQENNLISYLNKNRIEEAIKTIMIANLLAPNKLTFWRKSGKIRYQFTNAPHIINAFEHYLEGNISEKMRNIAMPLLQDLQHNP